MRQSLLMRALTIAALLLAAGMGSAEAASCRGPDISADRIQNLFKAGKTADDIVAACSTEILRLTALGEAGKGELPPAYEARAFAYEALNKGEEAKADYDQGVALAPGFVTWFNRSQFLTDASLFAAAVDDLDKAIEICDQPSRPRGGPSNELCLKAHFQRAEALRRDEKFAAAVADYSKVIVANPDDDVALTGRALAYSHLNALDLDIADLTQLIRLKKDNPIAYYNRGLAFRRKGDDVHALADFSETVTRWPEMATAHVQRAQVLEHMGQRDKALVDFRAAAKIEPTLATAKDGIARLGGQ